MTFRSVRSFGKTLMLVSVAMFCQGSDGWPADKAATPDGAKKISDFFATYCGKAAGTPPALVVTPQSSDYAVAFDISAMNTPMNETGIGYGSALLKYKFFEQSDGAWRVEQNEFPSISVHSKQGDTTVDSTLAFGSAHLITTFDPAAAWIRATKGAAERVAIRQKGLGFDQTIDVAAVTIDGAGTSTADGVSSFVGQETFSTIGVNMAVNPKVANPQLEGSAAEPVIFSVAADKGQANVKVAGLKPRPALDLWAFIVAHPTRDALAADEAEFKRLAMVVISNSMSLHEDGASPKLTVHAPQGEFVLEGVKGSLTLVSAGPASQVEQSLSATSLKLPDGLVPTMLTDFVPTAFDFGFKVNGFDMTEAGVEAVADMRLSGDEPPISKADSDRLLAKLISAGPVAIEISPSHVTAPRLDLGFEGKFTYVRGRPTGTITVHMRNFDKTVLAMKALGPDAEKSMLPALTMAKGLAKNEPDGALSWVGEIGADGIMKVNGLPLGKAPF